MATAHTQKPRDMTKTHELNRQRVGNEGLQQTNRGIRSKTWQDAIQAPVDIIHTKRGKTET